MKNHIKLLYLGVLLLVATSCGKDFLTVNPVDSRVVDNFYKTEADVRSSTAGLYNPKPWYDWVYGVQWQVGDLCAGDMYHTWDEEGQFFFFSYTSTNGPLNRAWISLYRVNAWCNSVINDMAPNARKNGVKAEVINGAVAEARLVRAWVYFYLTEYWKEAPIVENGSSLIASGNMALPKNTQSSIYEFIRRDLEFAEANLPGTDPEAGRATKWSAKGLLAKLYLTMASHTSDANSASNYAKAMDYAQQVITNTDGFGLNPDYGQLFTIAGNNNKESLFALQCIGAGGYSLGNPRTIVLARNAVVADVAWGGGKGATLDYIAGIESGDKRQHSIVMQVGDQYPELDQEDGGYTYFLYRTKYSIKRGSTITTVDENQNDVLNNIKKYMIGLASDNNGLVGTNQDAGNNIYFMRFAEMYLIYAEAAIGAGTQTSDANAVAYVNTVRSRAGLSALAAPLTFDQVMHERRYEFGMEGIRWFDIKRMYYRDPASAAALLNAQQRENKYQAKSGQTDEQLNTYAGYTLVAPTSPIVIYQNQIDQFPLPDQAITMSPQLNDPAVEYKFN